MLSPCSILPMPLDEDYRTRESSGKGQAHLRPRLRWATFAYIDERRLVDQIFTSSNPLISWLRQIEALSSAARVRGACRSPHRASYWGLQNGPGQT